MRLRPCPGGLCTPEATPGTGVRPQLRLHAPLLQAAFSLLWLCVVYTSFETELRCCVPCDGRPHRAAVPARAEAVALLGASPWLSPLWHTPALHASGEGEG